MLLSGDCYFQLDVELRVDCLHLFRPSPLLCKGIAQFAFAGSSRIPRRSSGGTLLFGVARSKLPTQGFHADTPAVKYVLTVSVNRQCSSFGHIPSPCTGIVVARVLLQIKVSRHNPVMAFVSRSEVPLNPAFREWLAVVVALFLLGIAGTGAGDWPLIEYLLLLVIGAVLAGLLLPVSAYGCCVPGAIVGNLWGGYFAAIVDRPNVQRLEDEARKQNPESTRGSAGG